MKLSKNNWLVRWAYWHDIIMAREPIPDKTNICDLFMRVIYLAPLMLLLGAIFGTIALPFVILGWIFSGKRSWIRSEKSLNERIDTKWKSSLLYRRIVDWKNRTCTIIDLD